LEVRLELSLSDREALLRAKLVLEHPGLAAKAAELLGRPIELGIEKLPPSMQRGLANVTRTALKVGLNAAVSTLSLDVDGRPGRSASPRLHRLAGGVAGAAGGFFGVLAMPAELPISTLIILRAIADIARSEGENLRELEARLACLEVLALGGGRPDANMSAETGYYAARIGLAQSLKRAAEHLSRHGLARKLAPPVADWITRIAARFSVQVSQEIAAKLVPLLGAATGAAINTLFVRHFQDVARAHFTIRRLERSYGAERVKSMYTALRWTQTNWIEPPLPEA
jgi:hypothetical protein